jgi:YggT family protein
MASMLLLGLVVRLVNLFEIILFIRIIISFVQPDSDNPVVRFIYRITDPVMDFVRRYVPCQFGMIDFSPMVIIILLHLVVMALQNLLLRIL